MSDEAPQVPPDQVPPEPQQPEPQQAAQQQQAPPGYYDPAAAQPQAQPQYAEQQQQQYYYYQYPGYQYPPQYGYGQPGAYTSYPIEPGNDAAVGSLITSLTAIGFLVLTMGVLAPLTLIASIAAIPLGLKGKKNIAEGKTRKHRDLAQAGFIMGIIGVALAVLAIAAWVLIIVFAAGTELDSGQLDGFVV